MYDQTRVRALRELPIKAEEKGFGGPLHREPVTPATLAALQPPARDGWLGSPRALLRQSALQHNIATMAQYCTERGVDLYPHAKTTMAPQLVAAQLEAGAPGITVATVAQARLFARFGVRHILIANEVDGPGLDHVAGAGWRTTPRVHANLLRGQRRGGGPARPHAVGARVGHAGR